MSGKATQPAKTVIDLTSDDADANKTPVARPAMPVEHPHLALLLHFQNSHLTNAITKLHKAMHKMGWQVITRTMNDFDSTTAQRDLEIAVDELIDGVQSKGQGLIVCYAGYGLQQVKGEPGGDVEDTNPSAMAWKWHAKPRQGFVCTKHAVTVDPQPMLVKLDYKVANDILFIFNSPAELQETYFETFKKHHKPDRNVQILHLRENWSVPVNGRPSEPCRGETGLACWNETLQNPSGFVELPVEKLAECIDLLSIAMNKDDDLSFVEAYRNLVYNGRREPECVAILGLPQKHPLMRGA